MNRKLRKAFYAQTKGIDHRQLVGPACAFVLANAQHPLSEQERDFEQVVLDEVQLDDLYHGGLSGRLVGDDLLPGGVLGIDPHDWNDPDWRRQFVYMTPTPMKAAAYARRVQGSVYRVEPQGPVGLDLVDLRVLSLILGAEGMKPWVRTLGQGEVLRLLSKTLPFSLVCERATVLEVLHG